MNESEVRRYIKKAKDILSKESTSDLNVKPFDIKKIKRGKDWFANDVVIQSIIDKYLNRKKS